MMYIAFVCILGAIAVSSGAFGDDLESTIVYDVSCAGNETEVLNCSLNYFGTCTEHSASLICQGKLA